MLTCAVVAALICLGACCPAGGDEGLLEELSARRANPLSGLRNVGINEQVNVGFPSGGKTQHVLTLQALLPLSLGPRWALITYFEGGMVSQRGLRPGEDRITGLGDTVVNFVLTPRRTGALYWGAGPVVQLPTATDRDLGSTAWAAGPSVALFVQPLPWTAGMLLENGWGQGFNEFAAQYWLNYNLPRGWFLESNATVTADWEGRLADRWTVPLAAGAGKVFTVFGQSMSAGAQGLYNVKEPTFGPCWGFAVQVQYFFP